MNPGQLTSEEYALLKRLKVVGSQRNTLDPEVASLIKKGLATLSEDKATILISDEGRNVRRVMRAGSA